MLQVFAMAARKVSPTLKRPVRLWDRYITTSASHAAPVVGSGDSLVFTRDMDVKIFLNFESLPITKLTFSGFYDCHLQHTIGNH